MAINYMKLQCRIAECGYTKAEFASAIGITPQSLINKLKKSTPFTVNDIEKACQVLFITSTEVGEYFFTDMVQWQDEQTN